MKILIIAAHPDDEVLGMGGTMKKLSKSGNDIKVIFLSAGILARRPSNAQQKIKELRKDAERALKILGVNQIDFLDFPDNEMDQISNLKLTKVVEKEIMSFKPHTVYVPTKYDVNVDHQSAYNSTITATRPKENTFVKEVISFEIPSSTEWYFPNEFSPNLFVDISNEFKSKINALKKYRNEIREFPHPRSVDGLEAIAKRWGSVSGFRYAEAFSLVRKLD